MLKLYEHTITKSKSKSARKFKKCSHVCVYHCAQLSYTIQRRNVLIIFPLNLLTIVIAQIVLSGGSNQLRDATSIP